MALHTSPLHPGTCYCPAGWGGPDCSAPRKRPCWRMDNATKRDMGWHLPGWIHSRCAGGPGGSGLGAGDSGFRGELECVVGTAAAHGWQGGSACCGASTVPILPLSPPLAAGICDEDLAMCYCEWAPPVLQALVAVGCLQRDAGRRCSWPLSMRAPMVSAPQSPLSSDEPCPLTPPRSSPSRPPRDQVRPRACPGWVAPRHAPPEEGPPPVLVPAGVGEGGSCARMGRGGLNGSG